MAAKPSVNPVRQGFHTVTPYLTVQDAAGLIEFAKQAFGATEIYRGTGSAGGIHAELKLGDSMVMMGGGGQWRGTPMPAALHLYVTDADAVYKLALQAGATSLAEPVNQPYGDREASVKDKFGNHWYIATHQEKGKYIPDGLRSVTLYLHPRGTAKLIDFLKQAFRAAEDFREQSPDGTVHHAKIRIGDSVVEMGEAHGEFTPRPAMSYLYVNDVDAVYKRALGAGATSLAEPADQPYGDRVGAVTDPFGNVWYLGTHIADVAM